MRGHYIIALSFTFLASCSGPSSERILNTYVEVNTCLVKDCAFINNEIKTEFAYLEGAYKYHRIAVKPFYDYALVVKQYSDRIVNEIQNLKSALINAVDKKSMDKTKMNMPDSTLKSVTCKGDYYFSFLILFTYLKAYELRIHIGDYRKKMMMFFGRGGWINYNGNIDTSRIMIDLLTPSKVKQDSREPWLWEAYTFENHTMVEDIVTLTKLQTFIRKAQLEYMINIYPAVNKAVKYFISEFDEHGVSIRQK